MDDKPKRNENQQSDRRPESGPFQSSKRSEPEPEKETVEITFDEKTEMYVIETNGLAAARYATQVEAESNLPRFQVKTK